MTDHRKALHQSYEQAAAVVAAVRPDQLSLPTPCPDYDVRTLVDHLVGAGQRAVALGRGDAPGGGEESPHVELDDAATHLRDAGRESEKVWSDDAKLTQTITMPWGETCTGATLVEMYLAELVAHSWDLARATGQPDAIDEELAAVALEAARNMLKAEYRNVMGPGNPFGSEVAASPSSPASARFVAFMGRDPEVASR